MLCMVVGAVPASGRRSGIVSDVAPNNFWDDPPSAFCWKGGHAEPSGAVHGCGVVLASSFQTSFQTTSALLNWLTHKHTNTHTE